MATLNRLPGGVDWETPADLSNKEIVRALTPAAVRAFLKLGELWNLRDDHARALLGGMSNGAFYELKKKASCCARSRPPDAHFRA